MPLAGVTLAGTDEVTVAGDVHIVSEIVLLEDAVRVRLSLNLVGVVGTGTSGLTYEGVGAVQVRFSPPNPIDIDPFTVEFNLVPQGPSSPPDPVFPLAIQFTLIGTDTGLEWIVEVVP